MADLATSAAVASLIVGLLTIPAASKTVDGSATTVSQLPDVSADNATPREVSRSVSSSGFQARIETAFNRFALHASPGSATAQLESPGARLKVERQPSKTTWTLTTSSGKLEVTKTPEGVTEKVNSPGGTLKVSRKNGAITRSFTGSDRSEVMASYHDLRALMEQKKQELDSKRETLEETTEPKISVEVNSSTASGFGNETREFAVIRNRGLSGVNLSGWTLSDNSGSFRFDKVTIAPGEKLRLYTEDREKLDLKEEAIYGTDLGWNTGGDTATLRNRKGEVVAKAAY
ncbi:MAG: lamin tail domain-containing protein [Candidatus Nanohaloarchaea archaeon]